MPPRPLSSHQPKAIKNRNSPFEWIQKRGHVTGDFELSDRTHLKEHLLNGKTLLLDLSKSDSLRKLSDCYQDQLSYIACNAKGYWGLYAPLIRPDSFIAWASDNFSDDSKAI
ncbi:monooxygenase [Gluconobacter sp. OJA]|uniref:aromatic-ring hydroxylase C-terminal domain-containing protein n=1 Tax=unclassified Gluconobacter TaxID=2644261 RepID=UPI0031F8C399